MTLALPLCLLLCIAQLHAEDRLISFNETYAVWMPIEEVEKLASLPGEQIHFMDITDYQHLGDFGDKPNLIFKDIPTEPKHQEEVFELMEFLSEESVTEFVSHLSSYPTRYYTSQTGVESARWLAEQYLSYGSGRNDVEVTYFEHTWAQPSIIGRINGNGPLANELVIIGGHIDSISSDPTRAPGADDDASGSSLVLEIFRVLAQQGFKPSRTLEFQGYAAEEVGLRGSQDIATHYQSEGKIVASMLQLDMAGYVKEDTVPTIGIVTDFTNPELTAFLRALVETYTNTPWQNGACGYACSDHASWYRAGYTSSFVFEAPFAIGNPYVHTPNDLLMHLNFAHMLEIARVGLGYVVEMSYES